MELYPYSPICLLQSVQACYEVHPSFYSMSTRGSLPWVKWPGREDDHWTPYSVKFKNEWSYIPTSPTP
jgi:hypothetical protein